MVCVCVCVCVCVAILALQAMGYEVAYERYQQPRTNEGLKNKKGDFQKQLRSIDMA